MKAWLPDPALLAEEQNKQQTDPVSSHTALGAALDFLLLSALRLQLPFPPFFANFSETYPSSMAVLNLLLQNCTALQVIYLLVPCPGCQRQLLCHRNMIYSPKPQNFSSFPCHYTLCVVLYGLRRSRRWPEQQLPTVSLPAQRSQGSVPGASTQSPRSHC